MANILVFGDSIGQGYYDVEGGWVDRLKRYYLEEEIKQKWEQSVNIFNLSISGDTSKEILSRFKRETIPRSWESHETIFIFAFGINDSITIDQRNKVPTPKFKSNLSQIINYAPKYSKKIIFLELTPVEEYKVTPMPWSPTESYYEKEVEKYDKILKQVCKKNNVVYLELFKQTSKEEFKKYLDDGVHPNSKGHKLILETVKNFLEEKKYI